MYVETFKTGTGPVLLVQLDTPVGELAIVHVPDPAGAVAALGPVIVAAKMMELANVEVEPFAVTEIAGLTCRTDTADEAPELGE